MKQIIFILLILSLGLNAQSKTDVKSLLVFSPDDNSKLYNEIYTRNFFFGNFGIKPLVNSLSINEKGIKLIQISAESDGTKSPDVMTMSYDKNGNLIQMNISKSFTGREMTVKYEYKEGLISKENFQEGKKESANIFHYANGKMIIENTKEMIDVYSLKEKTLFKESFLDNQPVFIDRIEGKCRITAYQQNDIDKICFSNFNFNFPLTMEEFTPTENIKTKKTDLKSESKWEVQETSERAYRFLKNGTEIYTLKLDKNNRIQTFDYLGNKSEKKKPVHYTFSYTQF